MPSRSCSQLTNNERYSERGVWMMTEEGEREDECVGGDEGGREEGWVMMVFKAFTFSAYTLHPVCCFIFLPPSVSLQISLSLSLTPVLSICLSSNLSLSLSNSRSIYLSLFKFLSLSLTPVLSICLSPTVCLSIQLCRLFNSVCRSVQLYIYLFNSACRSVQLYIYLFNSASLYIYRLVCVSNYSTVYLSVCLPTPACLS